MKPRIGGPGQRNALRGRTDECALLDGLMADVRRGVGRSLVVHGEPGIGKTALLEYLADSASDLKVVRAVGVHSEMELAYAGLQQLCAPLLSQLERLPGPQGQALGIAFGLSAGAAPDRFLVGLGVLSLFSEVADERPLLCVVDDAQWLDQASLLALAFVAHRLLAERVGIVFAARERGQALDHVPDLEVHGVRDSDARALLDSALRSKLDDNVRDRIIAEMRGNPLALLELPRGLTATQLAGGFGLVEAHGLMGQIEESFVRRVSALPGETKSLLLVAAAEPVGDPLLLWSAAQSLGIAPAAVQAAEAESLLVVDERVAFRHPLVRSAVYRSAAAEDRRAVHQALAKVTDPAVDPDRRAWHLAAAAAGPDEQVAAELQRSAGRAQARGGLAAAAAFLQRAVALTQDSARRADRALAAAQASFQAGEFDTALRLVTTAEAGPLDEYQRAQVDLLRGHVAFATGVGNDAARLLLKAASHLEPFDRELARETYLNAWVAASIPAHFDGGASLIGVARAIRALPPPPHTPNALDLLLDGLALLVTDGHAAAAPTLQRAANALAYIAPEHVLRWGWAASAASGCIYDDEGIYAIATRQVQLVRDAGALAQLPIYLSALATVSVWNGDLPGAASLIAEIDSVTAATGSQFPPYALLELRAAQGREIEASAPITSAIEPHAYLASAVLYIGLARYQEAVSAARQAAEASFEPWAYIWALPELVEASVRVGDDERARDALERLATITQSCGTDWALGIEARCRALLGNGTSAEDRYREAIARLGRTRLRPELARAHLLYGEWLRRENRRVDARSELRAAHELFASIGMEAFAERARKELVATGEVVRARSVEARDDLTAQERQIAEMARDRLSNAEIGARLFLSPRTVEWHLRHVFTKLGIRSRRELADALPASESELALV
jgi:DNA-binding CsgD family transcriptional regulator